MEGAGLIFFLATILILAVVGIIAIAYTSKNGPKLNREKYQARWLQTEHTLKHDNPESYQVAVMNADKLLDMALRERKFKGKTMGERMKSAQTTWSNPNHVWAAHKIRNRIAHEHDMHVTYDIAARALTAYKQGLKDLGAI